MNQKDIFNENNNTKLKLSFVEHASDLSFKQNSTNIFNIIKNTGSLGLQSLNTPVIPINDWTEETKSKYSQNEIILRNKLASFYRLADIFQWSQGIYNHITVRLSNEKNPEILINPFGLLYQEITARSLVKIDLNGQIIDNGLTNYGLNKAAYVLHSAIHEARHEIQCIVHLHTPVIAAVSAMKCGLLPVSQEAMIVGPVSYHDYQGIVVNEIEKKSIVEDLKENKVMILRNHGFVVCGETIEEALHLTFNLYIACQTQIRLTQNGLDNVIIPSEQAIKSVHKVTQKGGGGVCFQQKIDKNWLPGELEWEAWMRILDLAGFQTGHVYKNSTFSSSYCCNSKNNSIV